LRKGDGKPGIGDRRPETGDGSWEPGVWRYAFDDTQEEKRRTGGTWKRVEGLN